MECLLCSGSGFDEIGPSAAAAVTNGPYEQLTPTRGKSFRRK